PDTVKTSNHADTWSGEGVVMRLRAGIRHGDDLRVVLDLASLDIRPDSYTLLPNDEYGYRLVVDLYADGAQPVTVAEAARAAQQAQQQLATESGQELASHDTNTQADA